MSKFRTILLAFMLWAVSIQCMWANEALWNAARNGKLREVISLIYKGADVNYKGISGSTALMIASRRGGGI